MSFSAFRTAVFPMVSISAVVYGAVRTYTGFTDPQTPSKFGVTAVGLGLFQNFIRSSEESTPPFKALSTDKKVIAWTLALGVATTLQSANIYLCCRLGDHIGLAAKNRELR